MTPQSTIENKGFNMNLRNLFGYTILVVAATSAIIMKLNSIETSIQANQAVVTALQNQINELKDDQKEVKKEVLRNRTFLDTSK